MSSSAVVGRPEIAAARRLSLAADVGAALARSTTIRDALNACAESTVKNLGAAFARVWTYNARDSMLELEASAGMYTHTNGAHSRVPLGAFKIGRIAEERAPHLTNDVQHDPRVGDRAWAEREGLVSFAGYPLVVEEKLVGVMAMFARAPLDDETLEALAAVADLVSVGIERKRGEERLRSSEARHRLVSEAANEGIWFWDIATNEVEWNDRLLTMIGLTREEWGGTFDDWLSRVHPDDRPAVTSALERHLSDRTPYDVEFRLKRKDGEYRVAVTRGLAEWGDDGKPTRMAGAVVDIQDRRAAEQALRASEHRYAQILDSVTDMIFCKGPDLSLTYANKAACDFRGLSAEEMRASSSHAYEGPEAFARALEDDRRVLQAGTVVESPDDHVRSRSGETRVLYTVKSPIRDATGRVVEMVGVARDVTERRRLETIETFLSAASTLLSSSIEYEMTLSNVARMAVPEIADWCTVDMLVDGAVRRLAVAHVDPKKVELAHELERRWPPKLDDPGGVPAVLRTGEPELVPNVSEDVLRATLPDPAMLPIVRELGLRSWIIVPLKLHGATLGAITFVSAESERSYNESDLALAQELARRAAVAVENARLYDQARRAVEARDAAIEEVKRLNGALEERVALRTAELTEAVRELEAFSYTVSHDLRAPIRHVGGFIDLLEAHAGSALDEKGRRYLDTIRGSAHQMGLLIDGLLAFSRMGRSEIARRRVDLDAVVRDVVRDLEPEVGRRSILWRIGHLPAVLGDPTMVRLVFTNLLSNAVKYTKDRDSVSVEVGVTAAPGAREATFFVRDNGVGFNMDYVHKLFGVFQRLHAANEYEGMGIGLATVRRVVQRHGGRVWAEGREGEGATFHFTLPLADADADDRHVNGGSA